MGLHLKYVIKAGADPGFLKRGFLCSYSPPSLQLHCLSQHNLTLKLNKTECQSKRNPTGKPVGPNKQPKHQAPTISSIDKSLSRKSHRV